MWKKGNPFALLVGMQIGTAMVENSMEFPQKLKMELPFDPEIPLLRIYPKKPKILVLKKCMCQFKYKLTSTKQSCVCVKYSIGNILNNIVITQFVHQIPHLNGIIWYLSFSDWLISLSIMFSGSIHTVAKGKIFFFYMAKQNSIVEMSYSCCINSSTEGHLDCFHILGFVNNAAMNRRVHIFLCTSVLDNIQFLEFIGYIP